MTSIVIQNAAQAVAEARQAAEEAAAFLAKANDETDKVARRIAALNVKRATIISARQAAKDDPEHGAKLATIQADTEILTELLERCTADAVPLRTADAEARRLRAFAEQQLQKAVDEELLGRLLEHAAKLDGLLLETASQIAAVGQRLGVRPNCWAPSRALHEVLHRLHLQRLS